MANHITIDTVMNEPRQVDIILRGRKLRFLPFLSTKTKQITVSIPNPSIREAGVLRQKYYTFINAWVNKNEAVMTRIMLDVVAEIFKSYRPFFTKRWVLHNLDDEKFIQLYDLIMKRTKEKEEEYLKNAMTLQKTQS
jgi:chorismate mutase